MYVKIKVHEVYSNKMLNRDSSESNLFPFSDQWSWDSVVGTATGYGLDDRGVGV
jgi:hypothetical protein